MDERLWRACGMLPDTILKLRGSEMLFNIHILLEILERSKHQKYCICFKSLHLIHCKLRAPFWFLHSSPVWHHSAVILHCQFQVNFCIVIRLIVRKHCDTTQYSKYLFCTQNTFCTFSKIKDIPTTNPLLGSGLLKASIETISADSKKIKKNFH